MKRIILLTSLTLASLACAFYVSFNSGFFHVNQIDVDQLDSDSSEVIFKEIQPRIEKSLALFKGKNIWAADVIKVAEIVRENRAVKDVRVSRILPGTIQVRLETKKIAAMLVANTGSLYPITEDADILPEISLAKAPDVPLIRNKLLLRDDLRKRAVHLIAKIPERGLFSKTAISELNFNDNDFWISLIQSGMKIKMNDDHVELKSARVEKVLDYLQNNKLQARVIDADFSKKVVVKLRKDR